MNIKLTVEGKTKIHDYFNPSPGYTLCGISTEDNSELQIVCGGKSKQKINCQTCIEIIKHCQQIKLEE